MNTMKMWMTIAMFVAAGCGSGASVEKAAPAAVAPTPVAVAPVAAAVAPVAAAPAVVAATPVPPGAPVLASGDGERTGSRVEVHELKRGSGGTLTMKFSIVNDSDEKYLVGYSLGNGSTTDIGTVGGVHLTDPVEKKKYLVVRDGDSRCLCSQNVADFPRGRAILWAKFPAPPAGTERVTVVVPHFMPMDDVSISM
jgi:lipoprotein-anchoring transpeptidase ErfK/SrfK